MNDCKIMFAEAGCGQLPVQSGSSGRRLRKDKEAFDRLIQPVDDGKVRTLFLIRDMAQVILQDTDHIGRADSAGLSRDPGRFYADKNLFIFV